MAEHWSVSRRTFVRGALAAGGAGLIGAVPARIAHAAETVITDPDGTVTLDGSPRLFVGLALDADPA